MLQLLLSSAWAQVTNEQTGLEYATIQEAVDAASSGDRLALAAGAVFTEHIYLGEEDLTIRGAGPGAVVEYDNIAAGVFEGLFPAALVLEDLTIRSTTNAGVYMAEGRLSVRRVRIEAGARRPGIGTALIETEVADSLFLNGGISSTDGSLTVRRTTFDHTTSNNNGGAIFSSRADVVIEDCVFDHTSAPTRNGGAIYFSGGGAAGRIANNLFLSPTAAIGAAMYVGVDQGLDIVGNRFCDGSAVTGGTIAGVSYDSTVLISNNVFVESEGTSSAAILDAVGDQWLVSNNTFVGGLSPGSGSIFSFFNGTPLFTSNAVAFMSGPLFFLSGDTVPAAPDISYNSFFDVPNGYGLGVLLGVNNTEDVDPEFVHFTLNGDCSDDSVWPKASSPLIDAGDPNFDDPDGSRSDIGAYGGPYADPSFHADLDSDGFRFLFDCDDLDDEAFPGNPDRCDGKDNDCNGAIDDDVAQHPAWTRDDDGDGYGEEGGFQVVACDGPVGFAPLGGDCEDSVVSVNPGMPEIICNDVDEDCNPATADESEDDGDGFSTCNGDCDDTDPNVRPGVPETSCNGIDDDCIPGTLDDDDVDGDGVLLCSGDCDDRDPRRKPGNDDLCDQLDNDCVGEADDDANWFVTTWPDADFDGHGEIGGVPGFACPFDGRSDLEDDCDDTDPETFPGHPDECDGTNNDCVGGVDDDPLEWRSWWPDLDGDRHGDESVPPVASCFEPPDHAPDGTDCDDGDADRFAFNPDVCDGIDNDCTGVADDDPRFQGAWYADDDQDGFGDNTVPALVTCDPPADWIATGLDCDDGNPAIRPDADERCDGLVDGNCDGDPNFAAVDVVEVYTDVDGDGWGDRDASRLACDPLIGFEVATAGDCDDDDPDVNPDADEVCDGRDQNCSGDESDASDAVDSWPDVDGDGFGDWSVPGDRTCTPRPSTARVGGDCDDADPAHHPDATEACNLADDDCDGEVDEGPRSAEQDWFVDEDGDGFGRAEDAPPHQACPPGSGVFVNVGGDCDDASTAAHPGAEEVCDGLDNDCDGGADARDPDWDPAPRWADLDRDGYGGGPPRTDCEPGLVDNDLDCHDGSADIHPDAVEVEGNTVDENCDGDAPMATAKVAPVGCNCEHAGGAPAALLGVVALVARRRRR